MSEPREFSAPPLPLSFKIVIIVSVALIFVLGLVFFSQLNRTVTTSFQLYGPKFFQEGQPASIRVVQFDSVNTKYIPASIVGATLTGGGRSVSAEVNAGVPSLPADLLLPRIEVDPGNALLEVAVKGWNGEERTISAPVEVVPRGRHWSQHVRLARAYPAPAHAEKILMDLSMTGGALVEGVENHLWLRTARPNGKPYSAGTSYQLAGDEARHASSSARLGVVRLDITPAGVNQNLEMTVEVEGGTVEWEEMVTPLSHALIRGPDRILKAEGAVVANIEVLTATETRELYCSVWRGSSPLALFTIVTEGGRAEPAIELPGPGFYWVACNNVYTAADGFLAYAPLVALSDPDKFLSQLTALFASDPFFAFWPSVDEMTPVEKGLAWNYLGARLAPRDIELAKLANTHAEDVELLTADSEGRRDLILLLIAIVGFGLLTWTVAVAFKQHSALARGFKELSETEDFGEELQKEGITRQRSFLPALLILLTAVANLVALIWLLRLVFF